MSETREFCTYCGVQRGPAAAALCPSAPLTDGRHSWKVAPTETVEHGEDDKE